jgi:hypothetical protein
MKKNIFWFVTLCIFVTVFVLFLTIPYMKSIKWLSIILIAPSFILCIIAFLWGIVKMIEYCGEKDILDLYDHNLKPSTFQASCFFGIMIMSLAIIINFYL